MQFIDDIPLETAVQAFSGTSFTPEKRGAAYCADYSKTLETDYATMASHAEKGNTVAMLAEQFEQYRAGYRSRMLAWLHSHGRCMSTMICGPSGFNVRRAEKRNAVEHSRLEELCGYRERAMKAAIRNLRPDLRPIMAGDANALERLQAELDQLNAMQSRMKAINAAHARYVKNPESLDACELSEKDKARIREYKPGYSWEPHPFAPFQLTNNGANIRRIEKRIADLTVAKATPDKEIAGADGIRLEDSVADNRVRIFFPGKPDADIRAKLKRNGFRWAPSIGAWQAYRNNNAILMAREFLPVRVAENEKVAA